MIEREIKKLELQNGLGPFDEWFDSLRGLRMQAAVDARLTRVRAGNFGDCKSVGGGVFELRISFGLGLRVYYGLHGQKIVVLIGGGDKRSQSRDIRRAQKLWQQFTKYASEKLQSRFVETAGKPALRRRISRAGAGGKRQRGVPDCAQGRGRGGRWRGQSGRVRWAQASEPLQDSLQERQSNLGNLAGNFRAAGFAGFRGLG